MFGHVGHEATETELPRGGSQETELPRGSHSGHVKNDVSTTHGRMEV